MISVLILTKNEEQNLPYCLDSVRWCDDIVVFDSYSSDRTVEIAQQAGARVFFRKFDNERDHRDASLKIDFKYPWIYNPDADEIASPELIAEMTEIASRNELQPCAYRVRFRTIFMGKWIKHSSLYPTWVVRFFRRDTLSFKRSINLRYVVNGEEGRLRSYFQHFTFRKGMAHWFEKHNVYSDFEAGEAIAANQRPLPVGSLFSRDSLVRRAAMKDLSFRLPFRPLLRFLYMYFFRLGILDGLPGFHYCALLATYEYMLSIKMIELKTKETQP